MKRLWLSSLLAVLMVTTTISGVTTAATYTVAASPYTNTTELPPTQSSAQSWDAYEIVAAPGDVISYSVSASALLRPSNCVMLIIGKGHNIDLQTWQPGLGNPGGAPSYSSYGCVHDYTNRFPVGTGDGREFTVVITTDQEPGYPWDVNYTVTIRVDPGPLVPILVGVVLSLIVVLVIVVVALQRLRAARTPAAPPARAPESEP